MKKVSKTVDDYLMALPTEFCDTLEAVRRAIRAAAPDAIESIAYGMPAYKYKGRPLIYMGGAKKHCAVYGAAVHEYGGDLGQYDTSKGTIRFPPGKPLPAALVKKLVKARIAEIDAAADR